MPGGLALREHRGHALNGASARQGFHRFPGEGHVLPGDGGGDLLGAHAGNAVGDAGGGALGDGDQDHHRHDADDDAQHGEEGAHFVAENRAQGEFGDFPDHKAISFVERIPSWT